MGTCKFCGKPAGLMRSTHPECKADDEERKRQLQNLRREIVSLVRDAGRKDVNLAIIEKQIARTVEASQFDRATIDDFLIEGWEEAVEVAFEDGVLTDDEQTGLTNLMDHFSLSQPDLDRNGSFTKVVKGAVLRDIMEGKIPQRFTVEGNVPFNLQKSEQLVWVFPDVDYIEERKRTHYVGGSQGVSVRIARGLYYRTSGFKGERVESHESVHADTGLLGVTNKHLYFAGNSKKFRIRFDKIVAFDAYADGIGVQRDAATAKPQAFVTGDGWFSYNLITNLAQL